MKSNNITKLKLVFKENDISYGQDFRRHRGVPKGIVFTEDNERKFPKKEDLWLKASGYGDKPYGNGAIVVRRKDLLDNLDKITFIEGGFNVS